ncbi:G-protein coupled receptor [Biomphalaria glabrata]|nr:putative G-protein coupled receptor [Biomphalaria glabrata]KAI8784856.1 G-protein coupled receptor [Biomphalaria glabrata]
MSNKTSATVDSDLNAIHFLDVKSVLECINFAVLSCLIAVVGLVTNAVSLVVFCKQGFKSTVNVALAALAISDLCSLLTVLLIDAWQSPVLQLFAAPVTATEVQHLTAGLPHGCFTRVTCWITVYITAERCLCVTFPLQVKEMLTPRKTTLIICFIYAMVIVSLLPEYTALYLNWRWDPVSNKSLLGMAYRLDNVRFDGLTFLMYSLYMFTSFLIVIVLTLILILNLRSSARWRLGITSNYIQSHRVSNREHKAIKITLTLALLLIITFCPTILVTTCGFLVPGFSVTGQFSDLFFLSWSFVLVFDSTNASVNAFFYYRLSSKYRATLRRLVSSCYLPELLSRCIGRPSPSLVAKNK